MAHPAAVPVRTRGPIPEREAETILTGLYQVASTRPNHPALLTRVTGGNLNTPVSYGQLLQHVERLADGLLLCGVRKGKRIALQMTDCWGSPTLLLACLRMGAVAVPVRPSAGGQELERILVATGASTCVVGTGHPAQWNAETLLAVSQRVPQLRHRVVVGDAAATGAIDFERLCRDGFGIWHVAGQQLGPLPGDADGPCLVVVPGIDGHSVIPTKYRHSFLCAGARTHLATDSVADSAAVRGLTGAVIGTSYPLARLSGLLAALWEPVLSGGTGVFQGAWDAASCLDLFRDTGVTRMVCPAEHWAELVTEQRARPRLLPMLREAACHAPAASAALADAVGDTFGVPLQIRPARQPATEPV